MTPKELEVLLHCHCAYLPSVEHTLNVFEKSGLLVALNYFPAVPKTPFCHVCLKNHLPGWCKVPQGPVSPLTVVDTSEWSSLVHDDHGEFVAQRVWKIWKREVSLYKSE